MEWYDFAVFGFLAPIISAQFFPEENRLTGLVMTYGIFATGYLMRPLGGIFFGWVGDRYGRKSTLVLSILMMALPTIAIALLPTYGQIGVYAAILLVLLRMIQGLSVGGELIGSVSFMVEIAPPDRKGFFGSLTLGGAIGGLLLGSAVVMGLRMLLGEAAMEAWGWRIPFFSGILILLIGFWLREGMDESPAFLAISDDPDPRPVRDALRYRKKRILHLVAVIALATVTSYVLFVWLPTYLREMIPHPIPDALRINTLSMLVLLFAIPLGGMLSDRWGHRRMMMLASGLFLLSVWPLFRLLQGGDPAVAQAVQIAFALMAGLLQGPLPALMAEMFPVRIRTTSMGIGYNLSVAILGGTAPAVATWLVETTGSPMAPALYIAFFAVVTIVALWRYGEGRFED